MESRVVDPYSREARSIVESILCYPRARPGELEDRLSQLRRLGVEALVLEGRVEVDRHRVLGKGCTSIVVKAIAEGREVALKIRRTDSDRESVEREAEILREANRYGIGPRLLGYTEDVLMMECVEGIPLVEWLEGARDPKEVKRVLKKLLDMLFEMDRRRICHKELSRPGEHIAIRGGEPVVLDFETASLSSKRSNLTQVLGYLVLGRGKACDKLSSLLRVDAERLKKLLKRYKVRRDEETYREVLECLGLLDE